MAGHLRVADNRWVELLKDLNDALHAADTRQDAVLLGEDGGGGALLWVYGGMGGGVTRGLIFQQRVFQDRGDASAMPVHRF